MLETVELVDWLNTTEVKDTGIWLLDKNRMFSDDPVHFYGLADCFQFFCIAREYPNHHYVLELPKGSALLGKFGFVMTPDYCVLKQPHFTTIPAALQKKINNSLGMLPSGNFMVQWLKGNVASIAFDKGMNYFHWMTEILPRLYILEKAKIPVDTLVTPHAYYPFHRETLERAGFPVEKRVNMYKGVIYRAQKLFIPSPVYYLMEPEAIQWVRDLFPHPKAHRLRLYISRKFTNGRKILNEEELIPILEHYDFQIVTLDNMSVDQQAELFSQAEIVIGPHGAGFTNIMFMKSGARVIEFFSLETMVMHFYRSLSHQIGLEYSYILGEFVPPMSTANFNMPPEKLRDLLESEVKLSRSNF